MEIFNLQDCQFFKATYQRNIPITYDDVKQFARIIGCQPVSYGFDSQQEAEHFAEVWETRVSKAHVFQSSSLWHVFAMK